MRRWQQGVSLLRNRKSRREAQLRKLANMRAAKARLRMACPPPERPPKRIAWHRFEFGVRDKVTGPAGYGEAWTDFKSIRDVVRRLRVIRQYCQE